MEPLDNPRAPTPAANYNELVNTVFPMLSVLGPHLYHDPGLMYKVLRVARHALKQVSSGLTQAGSGEGRRVMDMYFVLS